MTTELAGAIEIDPPLTHQEIDHVRRLAGPGPSTSGSWTASRDGALLRAESATSIAAALATLRQVVGSLSAPSRFLGTVAAYDPDTRELVALTASKGRVTVRSLRRGSATPPSSNVVPLAGRRRSTSRAIG